MPYYKLLQKIIAKTEYSNIDIIRKCKEEYNISIDETHFSKIINNHRQPPKEEISRAIAKVCGVDERLLVLEGYIDKAPREVQEALKLIQFLVTSYSLFVATNISNIQDDEIKTLRNYLDKEPIADTLVQIINDKEKSIDFLKNNLNFIEQLSSETTISFKRLSGTPIDDDAMKPIIENGNNIIFNTMNTYNTSDIVAYKNHTDNTVKVRILSRVNSTIIMIPLNQDYKIEIYSPEDITILGKVIQVIKDL